MSSLLIKNLFPNTVVARYNLGAWQSHENENVFLIGREVISAGTEGEPDNGVLKLFEVDSNGDIIKDRVIWQPSFEGINLEDPRVLELPNNNLVIGMTAVVRDKKGVPLPFPAIVKIDSHHTWNKELPPFLFLGTFGPGKNLTPIDSSTFLFRPDHVDYHHTLLLFSLHRQVPEKIADIEFPQNLPWALWKIGTTMPPLWINDNEAILIIHGITKVNGKFIYSIGRALLTRKDDSFSVTVSEDPIITPSDFYDTDGQPLIEELHPELRQVVYSCGGIIKRGQDSIVSLYVNVGDRTTFEVQIPREKLLQ
jgi:predicted GH43/DUF377 family glycosyl hydrolase